MRQTLLKDARERRGWSQDELAEQLGVTQPVVSAYETGRREPTLTQFNRFADALGAAANVELVPLPFDGGYHPPTLADTAITLTGRTADRNRPVYEFIRGYREAHPLERRALLVEEPPPTGDARYDALLAALAEHLASSDHESVPLWTADPQRFLDTAWYWVDIRGRRETLRAISPAAFARRLIFVDPTDLEHV